MQLTIFEILNQVMFIGESQIKWQIREVKATKVTDTVIERMQLLITRPSSKRKVIVYHKRITIQTSEMEVTHPQIGVTHIHFPRQDICIFIKQNSPADVLAFSA